MLQQHGVQKLEPEFHRLRFYREGNEADYANNFEGALARARNAEQFSDHLSEGALQESTSLLVSVLYSALTVMVKRCMPNSTGLISSGVGR